MLCTSPSDRFLSLSDNAIPLPGAERQPGEAAGSGPGADPVRPMSSGPIEILLVEDDSDLREATAGALEDSGYRVATAVNGLEGLEWLREAEHPPSLILLDLMMPIMDGWQFRIEQRKDPALATIPVVILSAMVNASTLDGDEAMQKPVKLKSLLALVARYCGTGVSAP